MRLSESTFVCGEMTVAARYRALFTGRQYIHSLTCQVEKRTNLRPCVTEKPVSGQSGGGKGSPPKSARRSASTHTSTHPGSARSIRKMSVLAFAAPTVSPALSRGAGPRAKSRTACVCRAMTADNKAPVDVEKTRPAAKVTAAVNAAMTGALVALPAFAEEAATAASSGEISPFAGVVDVTVLGVVGLLAVQGNKKAEAAKAGGKGAKGGKKKK